MHEKYNKNLMIRFFVPDNQDVEFVKNKGENYFSDLKLFNFPENVFHNSRWN